MSIPVEQLLPIGSIIRLKGAEKRLMIFGVRQSQDDEQEPREYDYVGVIYPEGHIGQELQFLFDHADIEEIVFRGYEDEERKEFLGKLQAFYSQQEAGSEAAEDAADETVD